jgi:RNA polymerase-interacting CarD/CdnL/TRCF family regulator
MFKKGELVVYPAHGIGRIEDVQVKLVDGEERLFWWFGSSKMR